MNTTTTLVILALVHLSLVSCGRLTTKPHVNGFSHDLIHRDSPRSPFYNPSHTPSDRVRNAFHRSVSRANALFGRLNSSGIVNDNIQSVIIPSHGEYLMRLSIGTPSVDILAIVDTGSDLTWTQCKPCKKCFPQIAPLFDSTRSSTYKTVPCGSEACRLVGYPAPPCGKRLACPYQVSYGDSSHTIGDLALDTFTFSTFFGNTITIPNVPFGCGYDNAGTFGNDTSGIIGLGGGKVSIINQLKEEINGKFSYCLVPNPILSRSNTINQINFGARAIVSGPNVVTTPLIKRLSFYALTLEAISIGNDRLPASPPGKVSQGNIIIDSGTTLTFLPNILYFNLVNKVTRAIKAPRKEDPTGTFDLCFESKNGTIDAPKIVVHFTDADLELSPTSTFAQVDEELVCFTLVPATQIAIFGNLAQANFLIGYDLEASTVSFMPIDCTLT